MNKHLPVLITLLTFGSFGVVGDEVLDCSDPVTRFVESELCDAKDSTNKQSDKTAKEIFYELTENEADVYWCNVTAALIHQNAKRIFENEEDNNQQATQVFISSYNLLTYTILNSQAFELKQNNKMKVEEVKVIWLKKYQDYLKKYSNTNYFEEQTRLKNCLTDAPKIFLDKEVKISFKDKEYDLWIEAFSKRDSFNKVEGINIESWVTKNSLVNSKKYNQKRWIDWQVIAANSSDKDGKVAGIPAFEWAKQNYCMEIYGNFDCKD